MAYLAPIHRPSSVRHALKLRFLEPDRECLVVAKANRLEIYDYIDDSLILRHSRSIYGKVTMLQKMHPAASETAHLFVGTDRYTYFVLSWDPILKQLRTEKSYVDQANKTGRDSQSVDRCSIDPSGRFLTLDLFEGILTLIPFRQKGRKSQDADIGTLGEPLSIRIPELFLRSWAYLHPRKMGEKAKPILAVLYEDNRHQPRLQIKTLDYALGGNIDLGTADYKDDEQPQPSVDISASHIIAVPAPTYGLLVLAESSITYIDEVSKGTRTLQYPLDDATIFATWEAVDDQRWLLADDYGRLYFLMLLIGGSNGNEVTGFKLDLLGQTSRASVLTYLDHGYTFVGSHHGDSQVVKIVQGSIEVVQTISNIAPVLDFTIMDMGSRAGEGQTNEFSSGQARIVTGSGAFQDGSLRSVRSGVGLEELGNLGDMGHVSDMFSLSSKGGATLSDVLVVSSIDETRIFLFGSDGDVEEVEEFQGFTTSEGTLLAANVSNNRIVQCTRSEVRTIDLENGMVTGNWNPAEGSAIVAASTNSNMLAISVGGVEVVILDLASDLKVVACKSFGADCQISCITIPSIVSNICIVGFWQTAEVAILNSSTLEAMRTTTVNEDVAAGPRSVLLTQILADAPPTLFIALADGCIVTFEMNPSNFTLSGRKSTILGTQQANLKALTREEGLFNVFATCEHPSLIYGSESRIVYSAVTAEKASCICPFDSEAYPGAIAIATPDNLQIAVVDTERTTHVQTLHVGETVRRIAYSTKLKAFGLGTIKRTLKEGAESVKSHFKLVDEIVFQELDTYELNEEELVESVIRSERSDGFDDVVEIFIVGTAYIDDEQPDAVRGRILVFEVSQDRKLQCVTEKSVKGACRALGVVHNRIVAALVKTVVVFAFERGSLEKVASYRTSTAPIDISVTGNIIAVADLMKSTSILQYKRGKKGESDALTEVARHFQTGWSTAVAPVDENTFLESDAEGNLLVLRQNVNGVTPDDKRRLEVTSEIQLGEMVNRIRPINVPVTSSAIVIPRAFMATVEGSLYLFGLIQPDKQDFLMRLQARMAEFAQSPGHVPFNKYRAFRNAVRAAEEPFRFVDGELVETFLDCGSAMQQHIVEGLGAPGVDVEEVRGMVEGLRRMH